MGFASLLGRVVHQEHHEVETTFTADEGVETCSKPAAEGDWVVRNRCPATGNEEYLVKAGTFAERYWVSTRI